MMPYLTKKDSSHLLPTNNEWDLRIANGIKKTGDGAFSGYQN